MKYCNLINSKVKKKNQMVKGIFVYLANNMELHFCIIELTFIQSENQYFAYVMH